MKSNKNVVIKNSHSRKFLSGIFNACRCQIKETSLLNKYVEDPRYQPSGMTSKDCFAYVRNDGRKGFTLIELLVVVLIIGILAAVAVPQYQIAVVKSRLTQALLFASTVRKAQDLYYLANGTFTRNFEELDIEFPGELNEDKNYISTDEYGVYLSSDGIVNSSIRGNPTITIVLWPNNTRKDCRAYKSSAPLSDKVCKALGATYQAWDQNDSYTLYYLP